MSLANGKVSVCLEVCYCLQMPSFFMLLTNIGRLQFPLHLKVRSCGHQDAYGRAAGPSPFDVAIRSGSGYCSSRDHGAVALLELHVSEAAEGARALD